MNYRSFRNYEIPKIRQTYSAKDAIIYALSVSAGDYLDEPHGASFLTDTRGPGILPSYVVDLGHPGFWMADPATTVDATRLLHAEESFTILAPMAPAGEVIGHTRIVDVVDKGADKGALVYLKKTITDTATDTPLARVNRTVMLRGDGGYDGPSGPSRSAPPMPQGEPDIIRNVRIPSSQAFLYRLKGDTNPLHVEPDVAKAAGFERPILHGLCTFGLAATAALFDLANGNAARMRGFYARFSAPTYAGETLQIKMWRDGALQAVAKERNVTVLSHARAEIADD